MVSLLPRERSIAKVMFSQRSVCPQGGHAWPGCGSGRAWQGGCVAGGAHVAKGSCVAGETTTAAGGTHPTGMHSRYNFEQQLCDNFTRFVMTYK